MATDTTSVLVLDSIALIHMGISLQTASTPFIDDKAPSVKYQHPIAAATGTSRTLPMGKLILLCIDSHFIDRSIPCLSSMVRQFKFSYLFLAFLLCGLAYLTWKAREYSWKRYQFFAQYGGEWLQISERGLSWRKFNRTAHDLLPNNTDYVHIHIAWENISRLEILTDSEARKYLRIHSQIALNFGLNPHCMDIYEQEVAYPLQTLETYLQQFRQQTNGD